MSSRRAVTGESPDPSTVRRVADGVYRLGTDWVGWYLYDAGDAVTIIDCGFPGYHDQLARALAALHRPLDSVASVVLTHYHPDHVGSAERIRRETGATVYAPARDAEGVRNGEVPTPPGLLSSSWRPRMMRYMLHAGRNGARGVSPVTEFRTYEDGDVLSDAGGLRVVHTPGHSAGHSSLVAESIGVLFAGDAFATLDFFSGETGPRPMPFNEDAERARESWSRLENVSANVVLVGHGAPFDGSPSAAVEAVRVLGG